MTDGEMAFLAIMVAITPVQTGTIQVGLLVVATPVQRYSPGRSTIGYYTFSNR